MATSPSNIIKNHYGELTEKETVDVIEIVADLIVAFLEKQGGSVSIDAEMESQDNQVNAEDHQATREGCLSTA